MAERKPKDEPQKDESNRDDTDPQWEGFKDYVRKVSQIPKEELDKRLAEWERRKKKRAG